LTASIFVITTLFTCLFKIFLIFYPYLSDLEEDECRHSYFHSLFLKTNPVRLSAVWNWRSRFPYSSRDGGSGFFRPGRIALDGCQDMEIVLYHNPATQAFIYLRSIPMDANLLELIGLAPEDVSQSEQLTCRVSFAWALTAPN
jgi:hypothetical protein